MEREAKIEFTPQQRKVQQFEKNERKHKEDKFGEGKSKYKHNKIMAKLVDTSKYWLAFIEYVMNIIKFSTTTLCKI